MAGRAARIHEDRDVRILLAYSITGMGIVPDAELVSRLEARAREAGDIVEHIALPDRIGASPQQRALPWQLLPSGAYGDVLWAINFPACVLRHANRRIWFTRKEPFGEDLRAPVAALRSLLDGGGRAPSIVVPDGNLAEALGFTVAEVEIERHQTGAGVAIREAPAAAESR